ncbi:MAG: hypothetical protein KGJ10_06120 [Acidobacteriota bacterium]|nr:hypothetical protein [Acidobacteriota bacterium]MDE3044385.1 hypothetical protein [Acidobacteriota bacterium]MDE3107592.1 hypothetical protein [Acidobacteriota bacterium]MDE3223533.1 hypothetical protein [Acidobacteriota bacterium]
MKLDVYRRCSRREKMEVLNAFWRTSSEPSARVLEAARQYGEYAVLYVAAIAVELLVLAVAGFAHAAFIGWLALAAEALILWSLWWSVVRLRAVRGRDR